MFSQKPFIYLALAMGLMFASGSFMTGFQLWLTQRALNNPSPAMTLPFSETTGIRHIISSPAKVSIRPPVNKTPAVIPHLVAPHLVMPHHNQSPVVHDVPPAPAKVAEVPENSAEAPVPVLVVYENEMVIEFPKHFASVYNMKKAITYLILSPHPLQNYNLLAKHHFDLAKTPFLYQHVLNQQKQPIRYPKQAYAYADYLVKHQTETIHDEEGEFVEVHIPLVKAGLKGPAKNYQAWVKNYSKQFNVDPALVYAIMETESHFNPNAVSQSHAIGLMQLKPASAGKDVYQYVDGKLGTPSNNELFDSNNNIRMGTAYLGLLQHDYLAEVLNKKIKKLLTISSYNGGLSRVLKLFGKNPITAVAHINRMNERQVYQKLRFGHVSDETRRYLDKVLQAENRYKKMLSVKDLDV